MEHVETKQATKRKLEHKFSDNPFDKILRLFQLILRINDSRS